MTVPTIFGQAAAGAAERPLLTFYDDATGERTELSGVTLENWVAKTANLLMDGCGLDVGDTAAVLLPPHWQTAAVLLGCWAAGVEVDLGGGAPAAVVFAGPADTLSDAPAGDDRFALGLAPMALPMRSVPDGFSDYIAEVRVHGDRFTPLRKVTGQDAAVPGGTHAELAARATTRAAELGLQPGARVLVDARAHPDPLDWLLAPLAAGASVVLCVNPDSDALSARADTEKATRILN